MDVRQRLERHLRLTRVPPSRFGREAIGDPRLVSDLRRGRELRAKTIARISAYLDLHERDARS